MRAARARDPHRRGSRRPGPVDRGIDVRLSEIEPYLYGGFDVACPALADVMDVLDGVQQRRRRRERGLARRG